MKPSTPPVPDMPNIPPPPEKRTCPVCGVPCGIQFTSGKGRSYSSCDNHRVQALLMQLHKPQKPFWKRMFGETP